MTLFGCSLNLVGLFAARAVDDTACEIVLRSNLDREVAGRYDIILEVSETGKRNKRQTAPNIVQSRGKTSLEVKVKA